MVKIQALITRWTDKPSVAGGRKIHALQGGGPGMPGKFLAGITWCGIEKRSNVFLVPTDKAPTCKACLKAIMAHERRIRENANNITDIEEDA